MAGITFGERTKKVLRMMMKLGYKTLKLDLRIISDDLEHSQNPVVRNLNTLLMIGANHLHQRDDYQKLMVLKYGQTGLWIVTKDTAYCDMFFWVLDKLLEHPEKMREMLKPYVKPPEEWIPNLWEAGRTQTRKLAEANKLPPYAKSMEESVYTPPIQEKRHQKFMKKKK